MANSVYIGMSSALAAGQRLDVVSNNIANSNTVGFRQQRVVFSDYLVDTLDGQPAQKGFTAISEVALDTEGGPMKRTGNALDVALEGEGYFVVQAESGPMVTRAGAFRVDANGTIVDGTGLPVMGGSIEEGLAPISVRPEAGPVGVGSDGSVTQDGTVLAQLAVVTATGKGLTPTGGAHLSAAPGSLQTLEGATVASGFLEQSNVNPVRGMIELIQISHDYQTAQKIMSETRKLDRSVMNVVR